MKSLKIFLVLITLSASLSACTSKQFYEAAPGIKVEPVNESSNSGNGDGLAPLDIAVFNDDPITNSNGGGSNDSSPPPPNVVITTSTNVDLTTTTDNNQTNDEDGLSVDDDNSLIADEEDDEEDEKEQLGDKDEHGKKVCKVKIKIRFHNICFKYQKREFNIEHFGEVDLLEFKKDVFKYFVKLGVEIPIDDSQLQQISFVSNPEGHKNYRKHKIYSGCKKLCKKGFLVPEKLEFLLANASNRIISSNPKWLPELSMGVSENLKFTKGRGVCRIKGKFWQSKESDKH